MRSSSPSAAPGLTSCRINLSGRTCGSRQGIMRANSPITWDGADRRRTAGQGHSSRRRARAVASGRARTLASRASGIPCVLVTMSLDLAGDRRCRQSAGRHLHPPGDRRRRCSWQAAPGPYLAACRLLGVQPAQCVTLEDSPTGVRSAVDAGVPTVAIPHILLGAHAGGQRAGGHTRGDRHRGTDWLWRAAASRHQRRPDPTPPVAARGVQPLWEWWRCAPNSGHRSLKSHQPHSRDLLGLQSPVSAARTAAQTAFDVALHAPRVLFVGHIAHDLPVTEIDQLEHLWGSRHQPPQDEGIELIWKRAWPRSLRVENARSCSRPLASPRLLRRRVGRRCRATSGPRSRSRHTTHALLARDAGDPPARTIAPRAQRRPEPGHVVEVVRCLDHLDQLRTLPRRAPTTAPAAGARRRRPCSAYWELEDVLEHRVHERSACCRG